MDRQDIDALLIGALYGELTPADEARLTAHLESHPTDRGALDDLKSARLAVRESRIFELQLDPPQAVSALLLQEAHRRAPKRVVKEEESESWFYRFTRSFLAHPAMAAAAMLVLVVGVAGTLYLKKGDQFADKELTAADQAATSPALEPSATGVMNEASADRGMLEGAAGSAYRVGLDDNQPAEQQATEKLDTVAARGDAELAKQQQGVARERDEAKNKKSASIMVDTPRPQPKELPEPRSKGAMPADKRAGNDRFGNADGIVGGVGTTSVATGGAGGAPGGPSRNAPAQASPPPPPAAGAPAPSTVAENRAPAPAKPTTTATVKQSSKKEAEKSEAPSADPAPAKDNTLVAWAKAEHSRTVTLANKGDCAGAAKAAVAVLNRAPDYYSQFMATDRLLKKCQAYVAAERDAEAGRKQRAQKRATAADEPASSQ